MTPHMDVPILMYHDVQAGGGAARCPPYTIPQRLFESQLDYLRDSGRRCIGFDELFRMTEGGEAPTGREVMITFDDGFESFRTLVTPALLARGLSATVFVVAGRMGGHNGWDAGRGAGYGGKALMSGEGVREVAAAGMRVGSHSCTHPDFNACGQEQVDGELRRSKETLEDLLGAAVRDFAYPYGGHAERHFALLRARGYRCAVSIFSDEKYVTSNPYAMRRVYVHAGDDLTRFRLKLSGLYLRLLAFRKHPKPKPPSRARAVKAPAGG